MKPETFRKLAAAGLSHEQMALVLEIIDEQERTHSEAEAARKAEARDRVSRWRERQKTDVTLPKVTETQRNGLRGGDAPAVSKTITNIDKQEDRKKDTGAAKPLSDLAEFKAELAMILDADRVEALCAVRRKKNATFSQHAGRLLSKALLRCPNVSEAADEMVLRNWTGIKPDWLENRQKPPSQASPKPKTEFQQKQDSFRAELDEATGRTRNDEFTGHSFDLEERDWRAH